MPQAINPTSQAESTVLKAGVSAYLVHYAARVLGQEAPIAVGTAGYKAYSKRVAFAERCIANPEKYVAAAALLFCKLGANIEQDAQGSGLSVFQYLAATPQGFEFADADSSLINQWTSVGTTSGKSVWDALAEVNQSDII